MLTLIGLELRQRMRGSGWLPLLIIWLLAIGGLTAGAYFISQSNGQTMGAWLFSLILYFTLFLAAVVVPALGGGSINGDRESGVLTLVQTAPVSAATIVWAKAFAAWIASLVLVLVALPFLLFAAVIGNVGWIIVVPALVVLFLELAFFSAISVAFSGIFSRAGAATAMSYLVIALLSVGSVFAFNIGSALLTSERTVQVNTHVTASSQQSGSAADGSNGQPGADGEAGGDAQSQGEGASADGTQPGEGTQSRRCQVVSEQRSYQRPDLVWPVLAANPFVILADATPARFGHGDAGTAVGYPTNLLTTLKVELRKAQHSAIPVETIEECEWSADAKTPEQQMAGTQPVWFWGIAGQVVLSLILLGWATSRTRAPYRNSAKGQRIG
ncbi:ABC transporter permease [Pseudoclavibacter sp. CFCC 11306]|uniref:ABC transporter permease n=1 Tax=Pseudoclavibacter sp. CFCC 11306 TaxID=1564493 RepID=UPI0013013E17|nr:ABC transporter permease [Pseudoclavibacter sp. CFCC 11306]KAB1657164.1 ABC transporter permease [Pseudoclavibacter sp. CFCC 11306]